MAPQGSRPSLFVLRCLCQSCIVYGSSKPFRKDCLGLPFGSARHNACLVHLIRTDGDWVIQHDGFVEQEVPTSIQMRRDVLKVFGDAAGTWATQGVVELGCGVGTTTALLAELFRAVYVLDMSSTSLEACSNRTAGYSNVYFLQVNLYEGLGWATFSTFNDVSVAWIDAAHIYRRVLEDTLNVLALPALSTLVFHDAYEPDVYSAVQEFVDRGELDCRAVGLKGMVSEKVWVADGERPEGLVCTRGPKRCDRRAQFRRLSLELDTSKSWGVWRRDSFALGLAGASYVVTTADGSLTPSLHPEYDVDVIVEGEKLGGVATDDFKALRLYTINGELWGFGISTTEFRWLAASFLEEYQPAYWKL